MNVIWILSDFYLLIHLVNALVPDSQLVDLHVSFEFQNKFQGT